MVQGGPVAVGEAVSVPEALDAADGDQLTATATGLPGGLAITAGATSADGERPGTRAWSVTGTATGPIGTYPVTVSVTDGVNTPVTTTFTVKVVPAGGGAIDTTITSGPADRGVALTDPVVFGSTSSVAAASYVCTLDGAPLTCAGGRATITDPPAGTHRFTVAARSATGSVDPTPAGRVFTVPVDDDDVVRKGAWKTEDAARSFGGEVAISRKKGSALRLRIKDATAVRVLVHTSKKGGPVKVYLGQRLLKTVKTAGRSRVNVLKRVDVFGKPRSGVLRIKVAKNRRVKITGVVVYNRP